MAAPGKRRSAIITAAVMIAGSLAWIGGISLSGLEGSRGFFGAGPLIADANLILEVFLVAGITYGFLLARRGNIDAHQINQTTWVVLNIGLIVLVMAGSMQDVKIAKATAFADLRIAVTWLHAALGTLTALSGLWVVLQMSNVPPRGLHVRAGNGLFTMLFANAVQPGGRVYAVDISPAFIEHIGERARAEGMDNVTTILTKGTETELPEASVDLVYTCDTYHHFEHPEKTLQSIRRALKPGGRMVVIDFEKIPGQTHQQRIDHTRADKQTAIREIEAAGFRFVEEKKLMRENYFVVFQRP